MIVEEWAEEVNVKMILVIIMINKMVRMMVVFFKDEDEGYD